MIIESMKRSTIRGIAILLTGILMSSIYCSSNVSQWVNSESSTNNIIRGTYSAGCKIVLILREICLLFNIFLINLIVK